MMEKRWIRRLLPLLLSAAVVSSTGVVAAWAEDESGDAQPEAPVAGEDLTPGDSGVQEEEPPAPSEDGKRWVIDFVSLPPEMARQTVPAGTALSELALPETLEALRERDGEQSSVRVDVTEWTAQPAYEADIPGEYEFSPSFEEEVRIQASARIPTIKVTVEALVKRYTALQPELSAGRNPEVRMGDRLDGGAGAVYSALEEHQDLLQMGGERTIPVALSRADREEMDDAVLQEAFDAFAHDHEKVFYVDWEKVQLAVTEEEAFLSRPFQVYDRQEIRQTGDSWYAEGFRTLEDVLDALAADTSVTLTAPEAVLRGQDLTLGAVVRTAEGEPVTEGEVAFYLGGDASGEPLAYASLKDDGTARCVWSPEMFDEDQSAEEFQVFAVYEGAQGVAHSSETEQPAFIRVERYAPQMGLVIDGTVEGYVTLTVTVERPADLPADFPAPTGTVTFGFAGIEREVALDDNGVAVYRPTAEELPADDTPYAIRAVYSGDVYYG